MFNKFCQWLDSNRGPPVSEATAQPTEPQPLPKKECLSTIEIFSTSSKQLFRQFKGTNPTLPFGQFDVKISLRDILTHPMGNRR